jgi:hypothetical protein
LEQEQAGDDAENDATNGAEAARGPAAGEERSLAAGGHGGTVRQSENQ